MLTAVVAVDSTWGGEGKEVKWIIERIRSWGTPKVEPVSVYGELFTARQKLTHIHHLPR